MLSLSRKKWNEKQTGGILKKLDISSDLQEKIYDLKRNGNGIFLKITTYFPLKTRDKQEIMDSIGKIQNSPVVFKSIFSDEVSDQEWSHSKEQIKKKFQDELTNID